MTVRDESETILRLVTRLRRHAEGRLVMRWLSLAVVALMTVVGHALTFENPESVAPGRGERAGRVSAAWA